MIILSDLQAFHPDPAKPLILGLGNFDGLHAGHQTLLNSVCMKAVQVKGLPALLTFKEHPQSILHPDLKPHRLTSTDYKLYLFKEFGIQTCFLLSFTQAFSKLEPEAFIRDILVKKLQVKEVCLGYNARFGHERRGDAALMRDLAGKEGFRFEEIPPVKMDGEIVSSSRIRKLLSEGNLEEASRCLNRPFSVLGKVVKGSGRGQGLGFPTANLELMTDVMPPTGVYPVRARILRLEYQDAGISTQRFCAAEEGAWMDGVLNYGYRPTFESGKQESSAIPEVFLLDYKGDLYGQTLEIVFFPRLREEKVFNSSEVLQAQIREDVARARNYLAGLPKKTFTKVID